MSVAPARADASLGDAEMTSASRYRMDACSAPAEARSASEGGVKFAGRIASRAYAVTTAGSEQQLVVGSQNCTDSLPPRRPFGPARAGRVALRRLRARGDRGDDDGAPVDPPTLATRRAAARTFDAFPRRQKPGAVKRHRRSGGRGDDRRSNRLDRRARHRLLASVPREIFRREIPRRAILRRRRRGDVLHRRAASLVERKVRPQIRLASRRQRTAPRPNFHRRQRPGPEPDVVDRERRASGTAHRPERHRHPRVRDRAAIRAVRV